MFSKERIEEKLKEFGVTPPEIVFYNETDSTNVRAKKYAESNRGIRTPVVFIADCQSAGRGRRGKKFISKASVGIYITFLIYPDYSMSDMSVLDITRITPYLAVKLCEAVESCSSLHPEIKWVNDLYSKDKKLAGILVEGTANDKGQIDYLVCGLGINVYKSLRPREISQIATSIEEEINLKISREELASLIIKNVLCDLEKITSEETYLGYKARLSTVGKEVTVIKPTESYEATVKALNPDYSLTLTLKDGKEEILFTGEVSIKGK